MKRNVLFSVCILSSVFACGDDEVEEQEPLPANPQLFVVPVIASFPVTRNGGTSSLSVTFSNGGQNALEINSASIAGADAAAFSLSDDTLLPLIVDSRGAESIEVNFDASTITGDIRRAQMTVESNAENFDTVALELVGPAIPQAGSENEILGPSISPINDPVFPAEASPQTAVAGFYNLGNESLVVTDYEILDPSIFDFPSDPAFAPIVPGASCATNGEADCDGDPTTTNDDSGLFCYNSGTPGADATNRADDVCAISVPALGSVAFQLDVLAPGSTTLIIRSNDPDTAELSIDLSN